MAAVIGSDILDIGSRKARRQREDLMAPGFAFGLPGQFDLPNVADVGYNSVFDLVLIDLFMHACMHGLIDLCMD